MRKEMKDMEKNKMGLPELKNTKGEWKKFARWD